MMKFRVYAILIFFLLLTQIKTKTLTVDSKLSMPSGSSYPSLKQALTALYGTDGFLIDVSNTITILPTKTLQYFMDVPMNGTITGAGSITIKAQSVPSVVTNMGVCDNQLPPVKITGTSILQAYNLASFSINGIKLIYNKANSNNELVNITNVTFSSSCFDNSEPFALATPDVFTIKNVTNFTMAKGIYSLDAYKSLRITQCQQLTISQLIFDPFPWTSQQIVPAFNISNDDAIVSTEVTVSNIQLNALPSNAMIPMPQLIWVSNVTSVLISSFAVTSVNLNVPGANGHRNLIFVAQADSLSINNFQLKGMTGNKNIPLFQRYIMVSAVRTVSLSNFTLEGNQLSSGDTETAFVYISDDVVVDSYYPMQINLTRWKIKACSFVQSFMVVNVKFNQFVNFGGFDLTDLEMSGQNSRFGRQTAFLDFDCQPTFGGTTDTPTKYIYMKDITLNQTSFESAAFVDLMYYASITTPCVEVIHCEFSNSSFNDINVNQGRMIAAEGMLLALSQVSIRNNHIMNLSSFISIERTASSLLISNVVMNSGSISAQSHFIYQRYQSNRNQAIEMCFQNTEESTVFAEVIPVVMEKSAFNGLALDQESYIMRSSHSTVLVHECNFTNIQISDSQLINLGGHSLYLNPASFFADPTGILKNQAISSFVLSYFPFAEDRVFSNHPDLGASYWQARNSIMDHYPTQAVNYLSIRDCYFEHIKITSGSNTFLNFANDDVFNSSISLENNRFQNISNTLNTETYLIAVNNIPFSSFINNSATQITTPGSFLSLTAEKIVEMKLLSNSISLTQILSFYTITSSNCSTIVIDDNHVNEILSKLDFISITCDTFDTYLAITGSTFEKIELRSDNNYVTAVNFISFVAQTPTFLTPSIEFSNNTLMEISVLNPESHILGVYPISMLFLVSAEALMQFSNNSFNSILILPAGNIMTISAETLKFSQSNFRSIIFESSNGGIYANVNNVTISNCNFSSINCARYDCSGIFKLQGPISDLALTVESSLFEYNMAPEGTIVTISSSKIQLNIDSTNFTNNNVAVGEGLFTFFNLTESNIIVSNLTVIQTQICCMVPWIFFYFQQSRPFVFVQISDATMTVSGNTTGALVHSVDGHPLHLSFSNFSLLGTFQDSSNENESSEVSIDYMQELAPRVGILETDNFDATFTQLKIQNMASNALGLIIIDCNKFIDSSALRWNLQISDSDIQNVNLTEPIILIRSDGLLETSLDNLTISLTNTNFTNILSYTAVGSIIRSTTSLIGSSQPDQFSIVIENCIFKNITGTNGLIYGGIESDCRSIIWIHNSIFEKLVVTGVGCILHGSYNTTTITSYQITSSSLPTMQNSSSNGATQNTSNEFSFKFTNSTFEDLRSTSGSLLYWESTTNAISVLADNNTFRNIMSSGDGGIIYASYFPDTTLYLSSNESVGNQLQITLSSNTMEFVTSNQSGGVIRISSGFTTNGQIGQRRLLDSSIPQMGNLTIVDSVFNNISSLGDGGIIYESTVNDTFAVAIISNTFEDVSAQARGGAFFFSQPMVSIANNSFSNISASISGNILYSISNQINITKIAVENDFSSTTSHSQLQSIFSYSPTNLKIEIIPLKEKIGNAPQAESSSLVSNPIFPNFTSDSLQSYQIDFTLVYQQPGSDQQLVVIDETPANASNITLNFISPRDQSVQSIVSSNCSNSVCHVLPASIILKGNADDAILVNATYVSQVFTQFQQFSLRLRACVAGEINNTNTQECVLCPTGTYSLYPNDNKCLDCPLGAYCYGGANVTIDAGYYRSASEPYSLRLFSCNDTEVTRCLNYNLTDSSDGCKAPFSGPACYQCDLSSGYLPAGKPNSCNECHEGAKLAFYSIVVFLGSIGYQIIMIVMTYRENRVIYHIKLHEEYKESEVKPGMFMVILTTFFQLSSVVANFNTGTLETMFTASDNAGNSNNQLAFLLQCFFIPNMTDPFTGLKFQILFYIFSPIAKILVVLIIELVLNASKRKNQQHKRKQSLIRVGAVAAVLILSEQPSIIGILFKYLKCVKLDPFMEDSYITGFHNISCETEGYSFFLRAVVVPGLVFWAIVVPFFIFAILFKNRKNLYDSEPVRVILGNFINCYRQEAYYWGVLIIAVKILIYICNSVINSSNEVKIMVYLLILNVYSWLLSYKKPFINQALTFSDRYCYLSCMTMMMLVLLQNSIANKNQWLVCGILIAICFILATVNVLRYVFVLQIQTVVNIIKNIRIKLKSKQILEETMTQLREYHRSAPHHHDRHHRRGAIKLDLPMRYFFIHLFGLLHAS